MRAHSQTMLSLVALLLSGVWIVSSASTLQAELTEYWQQQYQELNGKIKERQSLKKADIDENVIADKNALFLSTDRTPSDVLYRRTKALIQNLKKTVDANKIAEFEQRLERLKPSTGLAKTESQNAADAQSQFLELSALNRAAALSNPLIDFDDLIFVGYAGNVAGTENHMCDQYNPWNVAGGGGLYMLRNIKTTPTLVDILKDSKCVNGSFKGSNLAGGGFLSPDLSSDGKKIVFAWTSMNSKCYHIFKVNIDGTELTQLTDGAESPNNFLQNSNHNDFDPCWLPNGRIAFISDRRGGYGRCHTKSKPTFTLHSMKDDGSDIICLSYHETNEWNPSVDNNGKIVYTRWDYVDRDDCIAHHLWTCYPDGRDPRSYHGNYPLPLQTLTGSGFSDGRRNRPCAELHIRAIPNSQKYIATSGPHHGFSFGDLVIIDPTIEDDGKVSQIKKLTTSLSGWPDAVGAYGTAWPLSEDYYICNKNNALILRDKSGNEQIIYASSASWKPIEPIPVKASTKPPVLATKTWDGERKSLSDHYRATIQVSNVYEGDIPLPTGVKVSAMRIVQVFPKETINVSEPRNGYPAEALARMSLGTVPVEEDGSVFCEAPVDKILYFQLLDEKGLAVQSMRSATYVHKGEQMACIGCHENKWKATPVTTNRIAFKRAPSKLTPDAGGVEPVNYARLAKPVFDKNCRSCHVQQSRSPDFSFTSLKKYAFYFCGDGNPWLNGDIVTSLRGGSRTTPGKFGASYSTLKKYIDGSHQNVKLTSDEYKRVTLWLDLNSNELGADYNVTDQYAGKLVWPRIDLNQSNPQGIESSYPLMGDVSVSKHLYRPMKINKNGMLLSFNNPDFAISRVSLFDLSGRCVYTRNFNNEVNSFAIDLKNSKVAKGTYIVNVEKYNNDQQIEPVKFIIN